MTVSLRWLLMFYYNKGELLNDFSPLTIKISEW